MFVFIFCKIINVNVLNYKINKKTFLIVPSPTKHLIFEDGVISDMDETKRAIINASRLPLSIIIVG